MLLVSLVPSITTTSSNLWLSRLAAVMSYRGEQESREGGGPHTAPTSAPVTYLMDDIEGPDKEGGGLL